MDFTWFMGMLRVPPASGLIVIPVGVFDTTRPLTVVPSFNFTTAWGMSGFADSVFVHAAKTSITDNTTDDLTHCLFMTSLRYKNWNSVFFAPAGPFYPGDAKYSRGTFSVYTLKTFS
jgi:hypothetical protein